MRLLYTHTDDIRLLTNVGFVMKAGVPCKDEIRAK
jgi:hypothetical protein